MAHISLNETSVEPHEGRIHDQKKTLPLNRMFSPMKSRRKTKNCTDRRDTVKKVANLSLELKNFNQGWQYKAESPSHSLHESAFHSKQRRSKTRQDRRRQVHISMTTPELKLSVDNLLKTEKSIRGNQTFYLTRTATHQGDRAEKQRIMAIRSDVSANGKVVTLNLFNPQPHPQLLKPTRDWSMSQTSIMKHSMILRKKRFQKQSFLNLSKRIEVGPQTNQFEIQPWDNHQQPYI